MQVQWIDELPPRNPGRKNTYRKMFVAELKKNPGVWAEYCMLPEGCTSWSGSTTYHKSLPGTEWCQRKVDGIVHVYGRWIGDK